MAKYGALRPMVVEASISLPRVFLRARALVVYQEVALSLFTTLSVPAVAKARTTLSYRVRIYRWMLSVAAGVARDSRGD